jgi:hypothetical protein
LLRQHLLDSHCPINQPLDPGGSVRMEGDEATITIQAQVIHALGCLGHQVAIHTHSLLHTKGIQLALPVDLYYVASLFARSPTHLVLKMEIQMAIHELNIAS